MKQTEINQLIIRLADLREPLADRHTSKQLEKLCDAIVFEFERTEELEELQCTIKDISPFSFSIFNGGIRFCPGNRLHLFFSDWDNDVISGFALALVKAAKQVRKEKLSNLKANMQNIISEIGGI